ncbi:MAG: N-acetylneuraminate synthase [Candidatus Omnitrophota bacterium]|nr:MAG: N-acetylneuraminate synthase [Candidatus Omnitrophota bacterium]
MYTLRIGKKKIGDSFPVFVVAEIGINHNGDVNIAKKLIDVAVIAGCDAVKFQKRNPEEAVPEEYKNVKRETPWGVITYLEYRKRIEFWEKEYDEIDRYCQEKGIMWFASAWDISSIEFLKKYKLPLYKIPSALITNREYLEKMKKLNKPLMVSTGMADIQLVKKVVKFLGEERIILMHTVSVYPAKPEIINLRVINTYQRLFKCPVGYSGHEVGLQITLAAVALGAKAVERHITLDRSMWGTDQSASVEPVGLIRLVRDIRIIETALGEGEKKKYPEELEVEKRLRKVSNL